MDPNREIAADFAARSQREQQRFFRRPKRIGEVLAELITRRGYGRIETDRAIDEAWAIAAGGALAPHSRAGRLRCGKLDVLVANSTVMQELSFQKARVLAMLRERLPDAKIREIRFRIGTIG